MEKEKCFVSCIVAAGGSGTRMGAEKNKLFLNVCGVPVLAHTLLALEKSDEINEIIISARKEDIGEIVALTKEYQIYKVTAVVKGGSHRSASVRAALDEVSVDAEFVAVHDGARPLIDKETIKNTIEAAKTYKAAACGVRPKCTLKRADKSGFIAGTVDRSEIYEIQTPQVFSRDLLMKAYDCAEEILERATDDCSLVERLGEKIFITGGAYTNIKVTTPEDILIAEKILEEKSWR